MGLDGAAYAAPVSAGAGVGFRELVPVAPASVMKVQVALAVASLIATGEIDGGQRRVLAVAGRTPGPTGISMMSDEVTMSVRDLVVAMLTISDNAATDELIAIVGLEAINRLTAALGAPGTVIVADLRRTLDAIAADTGFADYESLAAHDPAADGPPSEDELRRLIAGAGPLDPTRGTRTTAAEMVALLQAIWSDRGAPAACARVRAGMARQLSRARIASGFDRSVSVAAKSGALLGVVRNEIGVVTFPDGEAYAVAVFTRKGPGGTAAPDETDRAIGRVAGMLVETLRDPWSR